MQIDRERGVKQELWIDDRTHLVRKDLHEEPALGSDGVRRKRQVIYTAVRIGETPDPTLFAYDPARTQAKDRGELSRAAPVSFLGKPAPEFTLRDLEGREVRLADLRGKVVLLDFWATWCAYCLEALPTIELLHRARGKGLAVFGLDAEVPELAHDYLTKYDYTFPSLVDQQDAVAAMYHVNGWPTTVLVDRKGDVAYFEEGLEPERLRDALQKLGIW